ncbi:hypothetical protein KFK09_007256 [Dendrobium nobile]|uniref:Uncharacterized protein n=1 Tax=Dendrobium nobile TaxID=94219 RepID=A0A8T3BRE9_DENNO|nr:hypothetical protein KFK09_007256 [Dendrobium nobile]
MHGMTPWVPKRPLLETQALGSLGLAIWLDPSHQREASLEPSFDLNQIESESRCH